MEDYHRRILDRWHRLRWQGWWGDFVDVRFELGLRAAQLHAQTVLDVGCGHGVILAEVPPSSRRVGLDYSIDRLKVAQEQVPGALLVRGDMARLPFRDGVFDTILMAGVYEIPPDKRPFVNETGRALVDDGRILATTPNGQHWHFWYNYGSRYNNACEVEEIFSEFHQVEVEGYNPIPSIDMIIPRALLEHVPHKWTKFFYVPSRLLMWTPGLTRLFRMLMSVMALRSKSKGLLITAHK